jgi:enoyl-CoA hydratase
MTAAPHHTALDEVRLSEQKDGVVVLTVNRPPANALSNALVARLATTIGDLASRADAPALVLTGAGDRFFTAGGDVKEAVGYGVEAMVDRMTAFHALLGALEHYPRPLVCAVHGWCVGGGIEMTLFADAVYASTDARFVFPEINHGLLPAVKGITRARRLLGDRAARRLLLGGEPIDAYDAENLGIVDLVVPSDEVLTAAVAHARDAAAKPPAVYAELKRTLADRTEGWSDEEQLTATAAGARTVFEDPTARAAREGWNG